ncbi:exodeoxyribonuclease V subunit gamma, partial [Escherichia coli]|nr:exodeoxyribonuclease V subunit gamma [Escherichia coli]
MEVLRDELIRWLADTSHGPRRLNDILVLVPNIKEIEPAIRAVFPATPTEDTVFLPIKIAGVAQLDVLNAW